MLRSLGLFVLAAGTIALAWYGLGRAVSMPPSPLGPGGPGEKLTCISYAPFHGDQAPFTWNLRIPDRQIAADLRRLSALTSCVRTYSAKGAQGRIAGLAPAFGLDVLQGIWLGRDRADNRREFEAEFPGKEILIGEVGWPSRGRMRDGALPSPANQARFLSGVVSLAKAENWRVNLIEAFDQPWKRLLEGTVGGYWGLYDDAQRAPKFQFGEPVSNHPDWRLKAGLGVGAALLAFIAFWAGSRGVPSRERSWRRDLAAGGIALGSGLLFGLAAVNLPIEGEMTGDRLRGVAMLVLALVVPMAASYAVARGDRLAGLARALDPSYWRSSNSVEVVLAALLAATMVAAIHVALGLVFDPRYKDFPFAALLGPVTALAIVAFADNRAPSRPGSAERMAAAVLTGSSVFITLNEGIANWQALLFATLLLLLALTAMRAKAAPG